MNISQDELIFNAMLLGVGVAERVHGLAIGSTGQDRVADAIADIASGDETNVATGVEIRAVFPLATEQMRAKAQRDQREIALEVLRIVQRRHS